MLRGQVEEAGVGVGGVFVSFLSEVGTVIMIIPA